MTSELFLHVNGLVQNTSDWLKCAARVKQSKADRITKRSNIYLPTSAGFRQRIGDKRSKYAECLQTLLSLFKIPWLFPDKNSISQTKKYKMSDQVAIFAVKLQPSFLLVH